MLAAFERAAGISKAVSCATVDSLIPPPSRMSSVLPSVPQPDSVASFKIPPAVSEVARAALKAHEASDCDCSPEGLSIGMRLAKGGVVELSDIALIQQFFSENATGTREGSGPGSIEWDLRGGSVGFGWSHWITENAVSPRGGAQNKDECFIATKEASCGQV